VSVSEDEPTSLRTRGAGVGRILEMDARHEKRLDIRV
jgi:hypothetical protein